MPRDFQEQHYGILLVFEVMHHALPASSDAAPTTREAGRSEQGLGDFHSVEPGHVLCRIFPFGIDVVGLAQHKVRFADLAFPVQRDF